VWRRKILGLGGLERGEYSKGDKMAQSGPQHPDVGAKFRILITLIPKLTLIWQKNPDLFEINLQFGPKYPDTVVVVVVRSTYVVVRSST
jgi:hypothetical protein